jgi:hypothetical protein
MVRPWFVLVALILVVLAAAAFPQVRVEVADGRTAVTVNSRLFDALNAILTGVSDDRHDGEDAPPLHTDRRTRSGRSPTVETRTITLRGKPDVRGTIDIDVRVTADAPVTLEDDRGTTPGTRPGTPFDEDRDRPAIDTEGVRAWERLRALRSPWVD